jgi:hypothetical protein
MASNSFGAGAYTFYDDSLYAELGAYHSGTQGSVVTDSVVLSTPNSLGAIDGAAPRLRLAYERDWDKDSVEVGLMGMQTSYLPGLGGSVSAKGPATPNVYLDGAVDWQYQHITDDHIFAFLGAFTRERQSNNPAFVGTGYANAIDYLSQASLTAEYYYRRRFGGLVNWVDTAGTKDALLYGADGSPRNQYWVFELDYMPWLNTKFILQYDVYTVVDGGQSPFFNGGTNLVDGRPSDNNTLVVGLWMGF